jgi:hypothetical protein
MIKTSIYWIVVLLSFLYVIYKNRNNSIKVLIILCFYSGLAAFLGKAIENPYKIAVVIMSLYLLFRYNGLKGLDKNSRYMIIVFVFFSISLLFSAFLNGDYFNLIFSQYGKYVTPVCLYLVFNRLQKQNLIGFLWLTDLFILLLLFQVGLSVLKVATIGLVETTVGSIAYFGGGPATMLPVLGFLLIWIYSEGNLRRIDWINVVLFLFIAFASLKRAIWFIMPIIILFYMYFGRGKVRIKNILIIIPLGVLIFYTGIRLNPTLNKEGKVGGTFDIQYVMDYTQNYTFGKNEETTDVQLGKGRGGATLLLWDRLVSGASLSSNDFWGYGLREVYTTDYEEFNESKFGVNSKGSVTGVFQTYISAGFIGVFLTILFIFSIIWLIRDIRFRSGIALLILWDYLFYSGLTLRTQPILIMLFYIILYSNLYSNNGFKKLKLYNET